MSKYDEKLHPITPQELEAKRTSLHKGDIVILPVMQYGDDLTEVGYKKERRVVEIISRYLVVFRRANGMRESRTFVELCQMDRGVRV